MKLLTHSRIFIALVIVPACFISVREIFPAIILYEDAGRYTLVGRTRWLTPEKARRFCGDYRTILAHKYPELASEKPSERLIGSAASGHIVLLHQGDECRSAEGVPPAQADNMLNYLSSL